MKVLFWDEAGPKLSYDKKSSILVIEDLNPELKTTWVMKPSELFRIGWKLILASCGRVG